MASAYGYFCMGRGWSDNPVFAREPFNRRDAWLWLNERVAYADTTCRVGFHVFPVGVGQFVTSLALLSKAWGWELTKVRRCLAAFQKAGMITLEPSRDCTTITILSDVTPQHVRQPLVQPPHLHEIPCPPGDADCSETAIAPGIAKPAETLVNQVTPATPPIDDCAQPATHGIEERIKNKEKKEERMDISNEMSVRNDPLPMDFGSVTDLIAEGSESLDPAEEMTRIWNLECRDISIARAPSEHRRKRLLARLRDDFENNLDRWQEYCARIAKSEYLTGQVNAWRADLGWVIEPANVTKILEGRYDNRSAPPAPDRAAERRERELARTQEAARTVVRTVVARGMDAGPRASGEPRRSPFAAIDL